MNQVIICGLGIQNLNSMRYKLAASLICADMLSIGRDIKSINDSGGIDYIHFDVMDGAFVPRFGLPPEILKEVKSQTKIPIDVHLMIDDPIPYINIFADAGADSITIHAESTPHLHRAMKLIKEKGIKASVGLNPGTPLSILDYVVEEIDMVMLMAINPGIVGHKLIEPILKKISHLKEKLAPYPNILIEIDGGVTSESAPNMIANGADILVCGSSTIFQKNKDLAETIKSFREIVETNS